MIGRRILVPATVVAAIAAGGVAGAMLGVPGISDAQESPTTVAPAPEGPGFEFHHRGPGGEMHGDLLESAAKALGLTTDELLTQLKDGKSIADIAKDQNVELDKVVDAVVADILANQPDEAELRTHVQDMLEHFSVPMMPPGLDGEGQGEGPRGWKMHPEGAPDGKMFRGPAGPQLDAAADTLGMPVEDLAGELKDGKTIADVAKEKNVDVQKVIDAMVEADRDRITDLVNGD